MDYQDYKTLGYQKDYWWFRAKRELIAKFLEMLVLKKNKKKVIILNEGVGVGEDIESYEKYGDVTSIDISIKIVNILKKKQKKILLMDANKLDFKKKFDIVICSDVLEHIKDDKKTVKEAFRILKKGGLFIGTVPAHKVLFGPMDLYEKHYRRYSKRDIERLFKKFKKVYIYYWNCILFFPMAFRKLILKIFVKDEKSELINLNPLFNWILYRILNFENFLIKHSFHFPVGLSLFFVYQKP
ncbi:methyltransferase domain-containing protein [Candidatus Woesearchaeota archaeon]|nr:methyltransferase domain-containing protein [Candidatus Woesearchaeota archaeon]